MPVTTRQGARRQQRANHVKPTHPVSKRVKGEVHGEVGVVGPKERVHLVQERYQHNLYHLVVQAILWNQTRGKQAIVVLKKLLEQYPDPAHIACANESRLTDLLQPIGLHRLRAKRLISLGQAWLQQPPSSSSLHKVRYKCDAAESMWEISALPGIGKYAIDSYRIFHRDQLRGKSGSWDDRHSATSTVDEASNDQKRDPDFEPEWKRVLPTDKDLRAFLVCAWQLDGYRWDPLSGRTTPLDSG